MNTQKPIDKYPELSKLISACWMDMICTNSGTGFYFEEDVEEAFGAINKDVLVQEFEYLWQDKAILFHQLFQSDETIAKIEEYLRLGGFEKMDPEEQEYYDYNLTNARLYQPQHELFSKEFIILYCWNFFLEKPRYDSEFQPQNPASTQLIEHTWGFKGCPCWIGAYYESEKMCTGAVFCQRNVQRKERLSPIHV